MSAYKTKTVIHCDLLVIVFIDLFLSEFTFQIFTGDRIVIKISRHIAGEFYGYISCGYAAGYLTGGIELKSGIRRSARIVFFLFYSFLNQFCIGEIAELLSLFFFQLIIT